MRRVNLPQVWPGAKNKKEMGYRIVETVSRQQSRVEGKKNSVEKEGARYLRI